MKCEKKESDKTFFIDERNTCANPFVFSCTKMSFLRASMKEKSEKTTSTKKRNVTDFNKSNKEGML